MQEILNMDCLNGLKKLEDDSVDLIVTDPPYGIKFMGKDWDKAVPSVEVWKECLRVLKAGSFAFVMSSPRSDVQSQMIIRLQEAGFFCGLTPIYWAYATGFPKATNIGKAADKKLGVEREKIGRVKGMGRQNPEWNGTAQGRSDNFFKPEYDKTIATSPEAKALDGSFAGFQPKPAVEVIIVAMKPLKRDTFVEQALDNGKGVTWLEDARIPYESSDKPVGGFGAMDIGIGKPLEHQAYVPQKRGSLNSSSEERKYGYKNLVEIGSEKGRFPANLLVSDDILNDGCERKSPIGEVKRQPRQAQVFTNENCGFKSEKLTESGYGDSGSFSRYFSLDAWWDKKVKELPESVQKTFPFLIVPKASKSEKNKGLEETEGKNKNFHPSVKPLKLMSYLITLGSRNGDIVLDPFGGSGTTAIACELLGRNGVVYEVNKAYFDISKKRIKPYVTQQKII